MDRNEVLYIYENDYEVRKKISNGLLIHPSFGRVVISTGGHENLRCKLPLREVRNRNSVSSNNNGKNNKKKGRISSSFNSFGISASVPRIVLRVWWNSHEKDDGEHTCSEK